MPRGMANAKQLAMMTRVMDVYCERRGIPDNDAKREHVALEILILFDNGYRDEASLLAKLIQRHQENN